MRYYMFNKPSGCVTACKDERHKTVMDYFPCEAREGLFPIGRLDKDTEGLLIVTDDGHLSFHLSSPESKISKTYVFYATGVATHEMIERLMQGVPVDTKKGRITATSDAMLIDVLKLSDIAHLFPADEKKIRNSRWGERPVSKVMIRITEGKKHQVKKMALAVGLRVIYLERVSIADLPLDKTLKRGEYRELFEDEVASLYSLFT